MIRRVLVLCLLAGFAAPLAAAGEEWSWTIPSNMTLEATGPSGRVVTFTVTARWNGNNATVTCSPASGSTFPIRRTKVECAARFGSHTDEQDFDITIRDTTPPVITVPGDISVHTNDPSGAVVSFTVSATDLVEGNRPVSCVPASGTKFSIGTRHVNCTSTDTRDNVRTAGFDVAVTFHPIAVPASMTVEATSFAGAAVTYAVSAQDRQGRPVAVSCNPASGSTFPLGPTTVTCTATANSETRPRSASPSPWPIGLRLRSWSRGRRSCERASAEVSSSGSRASASDLVDGAVGASCSPASGARFPLRRDEGDVLRPPIAAATRPRPAST